MGDRILISQSASNGILYTYASSGLVGVLLSLISFTIIFNAIKIFFKDIQKWKFSKYFSNFNYNNFLRSLKILTLFGIDF